MILIIYFLLPTISKAIQSYFVKYGEVKTLFKVMEALEAQLILIDDENKLITNSQFCFLQNRTLFAEGQTFQLPNYELDPFFENSDLLIDVFIQGNSEIYGLTINNRLFHANLKNKFTKLYDLNLTNDQNSIPQLIASSENLILASANNAYYLDFRNLENKGKIQNWQSRQIRYYSEIIDNYIFSAIGQDGLEIYFINQDYLSYRLDQQSIGLLAVDFRDFSIVKINGTNYFIYILCKINGVIIIELAIQNEKILSKLILKNIGSKTDGIALTMSFNEALFVAYKTKNQYYVIQFNIELISKKWGSVARFNISHKIVDIDVNDQYILVQGTHTHFLVYYLNKQDMIPFKLTSVQQFVLFDNYIYGTTSKNLFQFLPKIQPIQIKCFIDSDLKQIEQKYKLMYRTNQGWKQKEFKVNFNKKSFNISNNFIFFVLLLFLISILFFIAYRLYQNQREILTESQILEQKIRSLPQNRASKLLMPHTFRAVQPNAETRLHTNDFSDENTIVQKNKKIF
ncbi:unnamed protein product [Paramecium sonneborni]|uniref:Transmembrane protein n=1 Tax=Paramecium sonneborni TaxID=65129 RepID=A0A8S1QXN2_9CILI|nr:unnamed protein product [Paramecium sonneborni]